MRLYILGLLLLSFPNLVATNMPTEWKTCKKSDSETLPLCKGAKVLVFDLEKEHWTLFQISDDAGTLVPTSGLSFDGDGKPQVKMGAGKLFVGVTQFNNLRYTLASGQISETSGDFQVQLETFLASLTTGLGNFMRLDGVAYFEKTVEPGDMDHQDQPNFMMQTLFGEKSTDPNWTPPFQGQKDAFIKAHQAFAKKLKALQKSVNHISRAAEETLTVIEWLESAPNTASILPGQWQKDIKNHLKKADNQTDNQTANNSGALLKVMAAQFNGLDTNWDKLHEGIMGYPNLIAALVAAFSPTPEHLKKPDIEAAWLANIDIASMQRSLDLGQTGCDGSDDLYREASKALNVLSSFKTSHLELKKLKSEKAATENEISATNAELEDASDTEKTELEEQLEALKNKLEKSKADIQAKNTEMNKCQLNYMHTRDQVLVLGKIKDSLAASLSILKALQKGRIATTQTINAIYNGLDGIKALKSRLDENTSTKEDAMNLIWPVRIDALKPKWNKNQKLDFSVNAKAALKEQVSVQNADQKLAFTLKSSFNDQFDFGLALTGTDIRKSSYEAISVTEDGNTNPFVGKTKEEKITGDLVMFLNWRFLKTLTKKQGSSWLNPGLEIGVSADEKPALFAGVSLSFGKYVRLGYGRTLHNVAVLDPRLTALEIVDGSPTNLEEATPWPPVSGNTPAVPTVDKGVYGNYLALTVSIRGLSLFRRPAAQ